MFTTLFLIFAPALPGEISHTWEISSAAVQVKRYAEYDIVEIPDGFSFFQPGQPALPCASVTLVIPPDAQIKRVTVQPVATEVLPGKFRILPAQVPVPISARKIPDFTRPDPEVYSTDRPFPAAPLLHHHTGCAAGFRLVNVLLCPFEYHPATGKLSLHTRLRVTVEYQQHGLPVKPRPARSIETVIRSLKPLVANPQDLVRFSPPRASSTDAREVDYLIITTEQLAPRFAPFVDYRTARGLRTELRTVEWIERNCPGRDLPERIRNLVRDYAEQRGLCYLLLAGDSREIPSRHIEVTVGNEAGSIPTDLYYGDLDYSWDSNHNNRFGEMEDSVDLYADVFVGRAPVDRADQVDNFIAKVRTFENHPAPDYIRRALLPSGWLWRSLGYHGRFVNESIAGITPENWTDRELLNPPDPTVVADSFDHGFMVFDPAGHGNETGVYDESGTPLYTSAVAGRQHNDRRFSLITSLACNPGNFEYEDCLAEVALNCVGGGAIGVMMNSRYGWGTPPAMGPSEKLCVRFYDFLLNRRAYELGPCHDRSREVYAAAAQMRELERWCMTEFNLLGDPTLDIWTEPPTPLTLVGPDTLRTGNQTLTLTVLDGNRPLPDVRVTAWKQGELFATGVTGENGQALLEIHPFTPGELTLTAHAHNRLPETKTVCLVPGAPEPYVVFRRVRCDDRGAARENGVLEPGETGRLNLTLSNIGSAAATHARLLVRTTSPGVTLLDSAAELGLIPPAESVVTSTPTLAVSRDARPGSTVEFSGLVHTDQAEYEISFSIELGYPGRTWADIDTGICALTVTARGTIGYDLEGTRSGRGFRYPETETSRLNIGSFCLGNSADYIVDRFYNQTRDGFDRDWHLQESLRVEPPLWNAQEILFSSLDDSGHPHPKGVIVDQRALGVTAPGVSNSVILVFDIWNPGPEPLEGIYAGILADFDVMASDRLHDCALTIPDLSAALMYHVNARSPFVGIKLLHPATPAHLCCIDHGRYIYPDSGMSEHMKLQALAGTLGTSRSDRPYNWSVAVSAGPFTIPGNSGRERLAFAILGARDSLEFIASCIAIQNWFQMNVGTAEEGQTARNPLPVKLSIFPRPAITCAKIVYTTGNTGRVRLTALDITGRKVATLLHRTQPAGTYQLTWKPQNLSPGIYFIKLETAGSVITERCLLLR